MNFNRFKKVVARDFNSTYRLFGLSLLIMMCIPVFIWLFGLAFKVPNIDSLARLGIMQFVVVLAAAISSMKIYKNCNIPGRGNYFAMMPASLGEKFASMMFYCFIVSPLAVFVGWFVVDSFLTLLPFGPFNNYIWHQPEWVNGLEDVPDVTSFYTTHIFGLDAFCSTMIKAACTASIFMFANTIFKKNKFIKTVLWIMLISFVASIVAVPIITHIHWNVQWFVDYFQNLTAEKARHLVFFGSLLFNLLVISLFSFFTYRRLKKMQY
ncbi:MAG: hypothetical protein J6X58_07935 [Bacteroidales bacterium]|nr:hypothetical protein [Bacteroidales bacterium]